MQDMALCTALVAIRLGTRPALFVWVDGELVDLRGTVLSGFPDNLLESIAQLPQAASGYTLHAGIVPAEFEPPQYAKDIPDQAWFDRPKLVGTNEPLVH